jgi:GST-like protein
VLPEGETLTESLAILIVIAERHPEAGLLPPMGSAARADALRWLAFMASEIYPMIEIVDYPARFVPQGAESDALREKARERVRVRVAILEKAIAGPWLLSSGFSVADIYAAMFSRWDIGKEWRDAHCPKLIALADMVGSRPRLAPVWERHFRKR